jgi:uncharacterized Ntn-hydrolase superfamily protein
MSIPYTDMTHRPQAHTYSIVAWDADAGTMGAAVQSHWFSVGSVVPWARAGIGVVVTQALANVSFGPRGLDLLARGKTPDEALALLIQSDDGRKMRQVALLNHQGLVAAHTGASCIREAGHLVGRGYSAQANMMMSEGVWPAMADAFDDSRGDLAERMLGSLRAAEEVGGDIRGRQSAALLVVRTAATGDPMLDRPIDLRVEDHAEPLPELSRLLRLQRAYSLMAAGDENLEKGRDEAALEAYREAERTAPDSAEIRFWHAVSLLNLGRVEEALPVLDYLFNSEPRWRALIERLPETGLLRIGRGELSRILRQHDG